VKHRSPPIVTCDQNEEDISKHMIHIDHEKWNGISTCGSSGVTCVQTRHNSKVSRAFCGRILQRKQWIASAFAGK
jgi:hypothetical protein